MTAISAAQAWDALRARLEANYTALPLRFQNETAAPIPSGSLVFVALDLGPQGIKSFGGGRGNTRWTTAGLLECYVLAEKGAGLANALSEAESIAAIFRAKTFGGVHCRGASIDPQALAPQGAVDLPGQYHVCAAIVDFHFDQLG